MLSRRSFLNRSGAVTVGALASRIGEGDPPGSPEPLSELGYSDVQLAPGLAQTQFEQTQSLLLTLNEDSLLKPWRTRAKLPAPGPDLGGWYDEVPLQKTESGGHGFAPGHCFGQWISALARGYAVDRDARTKARLQRLLGLYEPAISPAFYSNFRFPAYNYDKLVIGLLDAHHFANLPEAYGLLHRTTAAAEPHLPPHALDRDEPQRRWRQSRGESTANDYTWDESYTLPENLYLAAARGAGNQYRVLARRFLLNETYFDPLAANQNVLPHHHAYSFCNALSSAMQAYLSDGSQKHLRAATNAFTMIDETQSFATGGWGPNESFVRPGSGRLYDALTSSHKAFETPCGSYAHFKLTRYLLRVTRDGRYGDSMERVLYNTVLGAKRLLPNGQAFYYSDYNSAGRKTYFTDHWPCCSGTLPQVAADYRLLPYFRDSKGFYVNLYLPSTLRTVSPDGTQMQLTVAGDYPLDEVVSLRIRCSRSTPFALHVRIPAWCEAGGPSLSVNEKRMPISLHKGFATVDRTWKDGDEVRLRLPLRMRTEPVDSLHTNTVAVLRGPLVLFPLSDRMPQLTESEWKTLAQDGAQSWTAQTKSGTVHFRPWTAIADEPYSTYLTLT